MHSLTTHIYSSLLIPIFGVSQCPMVSPICLLRRLEHPRDFYHHLWGGPGALGGWLPVNPPLWYICDTNMLSIYLSIHSSLTHTHTCIYIYIYACLFAYTMPEKGGRKPAPSRNLFGFAKKCRGSLGYDPSLQSERCLHVPFFSHLSLLCNPSPLLPRYHSSSPCKLSCSEPQRTLLSVELRILIFFNMLASISS